MGHYSSCHKQALKGTIIRAGSERRYGNQILNVASLTQSASAAVIPGYDDGCVRHYSGRSLGISVNVAVDTCGRHTTALAIFCVHFFNDNAVRGRTLTPLPV